MRALAAISMVALIAFALWLNFAAPCGIYQFTPAGDIPGRCVMR